MTMAFSLAADASLLALAVMTAAIRALHNAGRAVTSLASSVTFAVTSVPTVTPMATVTTVAVSAGSGSGLGDGSGVGAARLLETDEDDGEEDGRGGEGEDGLHVTVVVGVGVVVEEEMMDD